MNPIQIVTTYPTEKAAIKAANDLVSKKIAACCQLEPIKSVYEWEGNIVSDSEFKLVIKTFDCFFPEIKTYIKETHNYDLPEIIGLEIKLSSEEYLKWMESVVNKPC